MFFDISTFLIFVPLLAQAKPQCETNNDCDDQQICHSGSCQNACRYHSCGTNAECSARRHVAECSCFPGLTGDPQRACLPCEYKKCMSAMTDNAACLKLSYFQLRQLLKHP